MKVLSNVFAIVLLFSLLTLTACNKDKEDPKIEVSTPEAHSEHHWGDEVDIKATFTDDVELKSYHVEIGDVDGNHTHEFHFSDEGDINGTEYSYSGKLTVPSDIEEVYYLHFHVTDAEGNETKSKVMLHFHDM